MTVAPDPDRLARIRRRVDGDDDEHAEVFYRRAEVNRRAAELGLTVVDPQPPEPAAPPVAQPVWRRCRDDIDTIEQRAAEPWVQLQLDGDGEIVAVRAGGIIVLVGPTGRGKTSLALSLLSEHAQRSGPAIAMSLELPADELTARAIGQRADASWRDVLTGKLSSGAMLSALPERLVRIDRDVATMAALASAIDDMRRAYPDEPILVAVDYVQLIGADGEGEIRPRIGRVMRDLDRVARDKRVVLIALSQGSRASSRALSSGERVGADTTDAGAESADLERWASVTVAIGAASAESDDGSCIVDLSVGKGRMTGGDRVMPARFCGRSGHWTLAGEARAASDVRAERQAQRDDKRVVTAEKAILGVLVEATEPMSATALSRATGLSRRDVNPAVHRLSRAGRVVHVRTRKRGGQWPLWTPERAAERGVDVVQDGEL